MKKLALSFVAAILLIISFAGTRAWGQNAVSGGSISGQGERFFRCCAS